MSKVKISDISSLIRKNKVSIVLIFLEVDGVLLGFDSRIEALETSLRALGRAGVTEIDVRLGDDGQVYLGDTDKCDVPFEVNINGEYI